VGEIDGEAVRFLVGDGDGLLEVKVGGEVGLRLFVAVELGVGLVDIVGAGVSSVAVGFGERVGRSVGCVGVIVGLLDGRSVGFWLGHREGLLD
jgi:hypothetical protein